ncbi:RNA-binding protein [Pedobacter changchengzhani]|uniref:RNA-binding protein n=1 Tax=Pedobacter changchengzhani TaxID=2529274 RepID=A0A4R5MMV0_9SPHI|nr:RNA-binding protein [Pedobacter changchengzhani]TDG37018.1 RNA-binding protein [Pedobacter changchengzhani]
MAKLFVGGLSEKIDEMDLAILCSIHGHVDSIKIVRDKVTAKCKGYAFLEIPKEADAKNIVEQLNGELFKGNTLTVKLSEDKPVAKKYIPKKPQRDRTA